MESRQLAYAFLRFLSEPANAVRQSLFMKTATPNVAAQALLPAIQSTINQIFAKTVPHH